MHEAWAKESAADMAEMTQLREQNRTMKKALLVGRGRHQFPPCAFHLP
jgi:hypothetical protein